MAYSTLSPNSLSVLCDWSGETHLASRRECCLKDLHHASSPAFIPQGDEGVVGGITEPAQIDSFWLTLAVVLRYFWPPHHPMPHSPTKTHGGYCEYSKCAP